MLWWERKFHSWNFRFVVLFLSRSKERKFQGLGSESSKERKFKGAKVPGSESFRERKFQGAKVPWSESSKERKFQGAKVPHLELSLPGANGLGSEKSSYRRWIRRTDPRDNAVDIKAHTPLI